MPTSTTRAGRHAAALDERSVARRPAGHRRSPSGPDGPARLIELRPAARGAPRGRLGAGRAAAPGAPTSRPTFWLVEPIAAPAPGGRRDAGRRQAAVGSQPDRNPIVRRTGADAGRSVPTLDRSWGRVALARRASQASRPPSTQRPPAREVRPMIHPSDPELRDRSPSATVSGAPVTCAACGCRLAASGEAFFHFNPLGGRDARGCRVDCADAAARRRTAARSPSPSDRSPARAAARAG